MMGAQSEAGLRILTNHPGQEQSTSWRAVTTHVAVRDGGLREALRVGLQLLRKRSSHDCVVLGAGRSNTVFAVLQALLPLGRRPCLMIDCLWYRSPGRLRAAIKIATMRLMDRAVDRYVVWARREVNVYSSEFRLPAEKFRFVPYHTTLDCLDVPVVEGNYLFSGGNFARDYPTLIEAVRGIGRPVLIASTREELFTGLQLPGNVTRRGFSHRDYIAAMAGCSINIVALAPGLLHSGGQQTFLNSMFLGKPTVVTDPEGARDYIEDGRDGLLVEAGNAGALRRAITWLLDHPADARAMGERARARAMELTTELHFRRIIEEAQDVVAAATGRRRAARRGSAEVPGANSHVR